MSLPPDTCATCGREFIPRARNGRYCTARCRDRSKRETQPPRLTPARSPKAESLRALFADLRERTLGSHLRGT